MTPMETGKHKQFNEAMETTQDVKAEFHKEIEPLKKTQNELKREMKTFGDQMKAPTAAFPTDWNTKDRSSGLEDKVRNG